MKDLIALASLIVAGSFAAWIFGGLWGWWRDRQTTERILGRFAAGEQVLPPPRQTRMPSVEQWDKDEDENEECVALECPLCGSEFGRCYRCNQLVDHFEQQAYCDRPECVTANAKIACTCGLFVDDSAMGVVDLDGNVVGFEVGA